ncbi:MAG: hypothetical protein V1897_00015 [Pseudomonadota bacterium]
MVDGGCGVTRWTKEEYEAYMAKRERLSPYPKYENRHVERRLCTKDGVVVPESQKSQPAPRIDANEGKADANHKPMIQYLWIPDRLPGMNEIISMARTYWAASAAQKADYTDLVVSYCELNHIRPMKRVWLSIYYHEKDKKRDPDNIAAGKKFILDGLVQAGVLSNDGHAQVAGFDESFCFDGRQGVEVILSEAAFEAIYQQQAQPRIPADATYRCHFCGAELDNNFLRCDDCQYAG